MKVHYAPLAQDKTACGLGVYTFLPARDHTPRSTSDPGLVTCKRCLRSL